MRFKLRLKLKTAFIYVAFLFPGPLLNIYSSR